jgi:hypothetical protein
LAALGRMLEMEAAAARPNNATIKQIYSMLTLEYVSLRASK